MKELRSKKTGAVHIVSDQIYDQIVINDMAKKYKVRDITPVRQIVVGPKLDKVK